MNTSQASPVGINSFFGDDQVNLRELKLLGDIELILELAGVFGVEVQKLASIISSEAISIDQYDYYGPMGQAVRAYKLITTSTQDTMSKADYFSRIYIHRPTTTVSSVDAILVH